MARWTGRVDIDDVYTRDNPTLDDAIGHLDRGELIGLALGRARGLRPMRADRLQALGLPQDQLTPEERAELAATSRRTRRRSRTRR